MNKKFIPFNDKQYSLIGNSLTFNLMKLWIDDSISHKNEKLSDNFSEHIHELNDIYGDIKSKYGADTASLYLSMFAAWEDPLISLKKGLQLANALDEVKDLVQQRNIDLGESLPEAYKYANKITFNHENYKEYFPRNGIESCVGLGVLSGISALSLGFELDGLILYNPDAYKTKGTDGWHFVLEGDQLGFVDLNNVVKIIKNWHDYSESLNSNDPGTYYLMERFNFFHSISDILTSKMHYEISSLCIDGGDIDIGRVSKYELMDFAKKLNSIIKIRDNLIANDLLQKVYFAIAFNHYNEAIAIHNDIHQFNDPDLVLIAKYNYQEAINYCSLALEILNNNIFLNENHERMSALQEWVTETFPSNIGSCASQLINLQNI